MDGQVEEGVANAPPAIPPIPRVHPPRSASGVRAATDGSGWSLDWVRLVARPTDPGRLRLHAVLLHPIEDTPSLPTRLRVLRNLIASSGNELRLDRMSEILVDGHHVILDGDVDEVSALNQVQVADELAKADFLHERAALRPALHAFEGHESRGWRRRRGRRLPARGRPQDGRHERPHPARGADRSAETLNLTPVRRRRAVALTDGSAGVDVKGEFDA